MSTTTQPLKYLWSAYFSDGYIIDQPADDRYSKHDESAEWNPSAFRDIIEYGEKSPIRIFSLLAKKPKCIFGVDLNRGVFFTGNLNGVSPKEYSLEEIALTDRKLIYFREMKQEWVDGVGQEPYVSRYCVGYKGKDTEGNIHKKVIYVD